MATSDTEPIKKPEPETTDELAFCDSCAMSVLSMLLQHDLTVDHDRVAEKAYRVAYAMLKLRRTLIAQIHEPVTLPAVTR